MKAGPPPADGTAQPAASALAAGLRYVSDESRGIRRHRAGTKFTYTWPRGQAVRDHKTLARISALAVPPAWSDVWICARADGHLQATGRDKRGRKQYRYHRQWRTVRDAVKYERLIAFAEALPRIRLHVQRDLGKVGLCRDKVLAMCVRLLEETLIRVGNDEYTRQNKSFGLTTLQDRHATVAGSKVRFRFRSKHGVMREVEITDPRLARLVKRCQDLPGQDLFQYVDEEGQPRDVSSGDVNEYLHRVSGLEITAKDFRTWAGTVLATSLFREIASSPNGSPNPAMETEKTRRAQLVRTLERVAERLGNTVAVCRECYVHPAVIDAYLAGHLTPATDELELMLLNRSEHRLSVGERATLELLKRQTGGATRESESVSNRGPKAGQ